MEVSSARVVVDVDASVAERLGESGDCFRQIAVAEERNDGRTSTLERREHAEIQRGDGIEQHGVA